MIPLARPDIDFCRHDGLIDHELVAGTRIALIGAGGAAGLAMSLARCGITQFTLVDPDTIGATNPATQAHDVVDVGRPKVAALGARLRRINPRVHATAIARRYDQLDSRQFAALWSGSDLVLAMTDSFEVQAAINRDAIANETPALFAICYIGSGAVEITGTLPDTYNAGDGCHRCHAAARFDAYAGGFQNPSVIASHALAADYLNALIGNVVIGLVHHAAGSPLPLAALGRAFAERPCLISRILPQFGAGHGEAFAGALPMPFVTNLFALDSLPGWICPDCGSSAGKAVDAA